MNRYNLGGHSGCQIYLIAEEDGQAFVRKISKDFDYNERLKIQSEKQSQFNGGFIKTPKVLNIGMTEEGLFFFDMEYIQGITLAEYIKTMEIGKVKGLVETLVDNIVPREICIPNEKEGKNTVEFFSKKLESLAERLSNHNNTVINKALEMLKVHDWSRITPSQCHGDMTLENIIIKNENLYFIDFLDSFYDSWFLDIGTLLQDVQVLWSYRFDNEVSMNTVLRLIVFRDLLINRIKNINEKYVVEIYYSLLQKLIRIFPYANDKRTYQFLNEKTNLVIKKIYELES